MSALPVLVDSDTLSELSRGRTRVVEQVRRYLEQNGRLTISAISVLERIRGYQLALRAGQAFELQLQQFRAFAASCRVLPVDSVVVSQAALIWAALPARSRTGIGDILIAATAIAHGMPVASRNLKDFGRIAELEGIELEIVDWTR